MSMIDPVAPKALRPGDVSVRDWLMDSHVCVCTHMDMRVLMKVAIVSDRSPTSWHLVSIGFDASSWSQPTRRGSVC